MDIELKDFQECYKPILIVVVIVIIILVLVGYGKKSEGMLFYPPHVRVTRTGLKYFDRPYTHDLREQLNVIIVPPVVARSMPPTGPGSIPVPVIQPPPPSQTQVDAYPAGSGATFAPGSQGEPVSVKVGGNSNNLPGAINGGNDEVVSYG